MLLSLLVGCKNENEDQVIKFLEKSMNLSASNIELGKIIVGEKTEPSLEERQALPFLGLKDMYSYSVNVSFKAKEDCVAIAEARTRSLFNEKNVSCRTIKSGETPSLEYIADYGKSMIGTRTAPIYAEGKIIKNGETFSVKGHLMYFIKENNERNSETHLVGLQ
jgi:hypothetical protein